MHLFISKETSCKTHAQNARTHTRGHALARRGGAGRGGARTHALRHARAEAGTLACRHAPCCCPARRRARRARRKPIVARRPARRAAARPRRGVWRRRAARPARPARRAVGCRMEWSRAEWMGTRRTEATEARERNRDGDTGGKWYMCVCVCVCLPLRAIPTGTRSMHAISRKAALPACRACVRCRCMLMHARTQFMRMHACLTKRVPARVRRRCARRA